MRSRYLIFSIIVATVLGLDLLTKHMALTYLGNGNSIEVIPHFFNLILVYNSGAAFGILNNPDTTWQIWLFLSVTIVTMFVILHLLRNLDGGPFTLIGLSLIMGGAFGNLVDRIRYHSVVDFLDFYWGNWHWPAFNVADIAICVGAGLVILTLWRKPEQKLQKKK